MSVMYVVGVCLMCVGVVMILVALFESGSGSCGSRGIPPVRVEHHLFLYDDDSDEDDD